MKKAGVVGHPIGHSISPAFQQAALNAAGIKAAYSPYDVAPTKLAAFVRGLREPCWLGVNVTIPHKQAVLPMLDRVSPAARAVGAVNTIVVGAGRLQGENTDVGGFLRSLRERGLDPSGGATVVLGCGGAARAVVAGLCAGGAGSIAVLARRAEQAAALVRDVSAECSRSRLTVHQWHAPELPELVSSASLVVNTTPLGMKGGPAPAESPLPEAVLHPALTVYDLVYNPLRTPLLAAAERAGARAVDGLDMLVYQGAEAFELWTGVAAPVDVMRSAAREAVRG